MARIRIVDEWLRSPVSPPSRYRAILVVADSWAEQRVLMRAFASSPDQTRPTIVLHNQELAIGPAGTDPHGQWGIHVQPPVDGHAQALRAQLEFAARRIAGSKGTPARLEDEVSSFERKRTGNWIADGPGASASSSASASASASASTSASASADGPASTSASASPRQTYFDPSMAAAVAPQAPAVPNYYEPAEVAPPNQSPVIPSAASIAGPHEQPCLTPASARPAHGAATVMPTAGPVPTPPAGFRRRRRRGWTSPVPTRPAPPVAGASVGKTTALGYAPGTAALDKPLPQPRPKSRLSSAVGYTVPLGFRLSDAERNVLNALGESSPLTARHVATIVGAEDGVAWMEALMAKLADHGIDLIEPGDDVAGEPTYLLRR